MNPISSIKTLIVVAMCWITTLTQAQTARKNSILFQYTAPLLTLSENPDKTPLGLTYERQVFQKNWFQVRALVNGSLYKYKWVNNQRIVFDNGRVVEPRTDNFDVKSFGVGAIAGLGKGWFKLDAGFLYQMEFVKQSSVIVGSGNQTASFNRGFVNPHFAVRADFDFVSIKMGITGYQNYTGISTSAEGQACLMLCGGINF
jgi:hypothetical protein